MIYLLPVMISIAQGFLLTRLLLGKTAPQRWPWLLFAGGLIGLGTSGLLTFTSLLFFNRIVPGYIIGINIAALVGLGFALWRSGHIKTSFEIKRQDIIVILALGIMTIPTIIHATLYPYGGWDAWSCWNLKARFLFLGGTEWSNMFDPAMWRSNTAYPLLLPLINVWSWCFGNEPASIAPLINSCLITFLAAGLLYFSLDELNKLKHLNLLAPALILLNSFMLKLASSQYSDLLMGTFLLLTISSFLLYIRSKDPGTLQIAILAAGLMSFTKSEGLILALVTIMMMGIAITMDSKDQKIFSQNIWKLLLTLAAAFLVTTIFQLFYAPNSHTFINGFVSIEKPAGIERLEAVFVFLGRELVSLKWNGLWLLAAAGVLVTGKRAFRNGLWTVPAIILAYLSIIFGFYWVNTFFDIAWWLSTTLNRILFALTPTIIFWLFLAL
jgi:hypothetical protein